MTETTATKRIDLLLTPPTLENALSIEHTDELVLLDKEPYSGDLPVVNYGLAQESLQSLADIPSPRANTYVLNVKEMTMEGDRVRLRTNYTTMRSQFALRRWVPALPPESKERQLILQYVLPIGGAMILETADEHILIEERGKVEIPGKYHPAPAGGCETRDWRVFPEPFRSIQGEAWEETALLPGQDYGPVSLIGVARDHTEGLNPVFTYHAKTSLALEEVKQKADNLAPEAGEHQRLFGASVHPKGLLDFLIQHQEKIIGNGLGEILVFGSTRFGREEWLDPAIRELAKEGWEVHPYDYFPPRTNIASGWFY